MKCCDHLAHLDFHNDLVSKFLARTTQTAALYHDTPFASMAWGSRGNLIAAFVKEHDRHQNDCTIQFTEGDEGTHINGAKRGINTRLQDYCRISLDGAKVRVEVKSSQLTFDLHNLRWKFHFRNVKLKWFDELRLVMYTPWGMEIFVWDGKTGLSTDGKRTESQGHSIYFAGPSKQVDARQAFGNILNSKVGDCQHVGGIYWDS
eukprot:gnl/MRDRNA2_/MRDRNA2_410537_c0_seq1.p1 gnl/MRDRNA2_/MRDRNA2_410537_c0~~gnl/MRDRNA2_/MRDRNA2_410537_c0_seq1.p1  ORF type:complete len:204 (-),score=30.53 gnl/MRDRNA2_/MRDRNA2_410537_c0_seq1:12-623(-)